MKLSLAMAAIPIEEYSAIAVECERLDLESVWFPDHLAIPTWRNTPYPYARTGEPPFPSTMPFYDVWVLTGMVAAATSRIKIGTGVFILPLRPAVLTARAASTAQHASDGRFLLGTGTGWLEEEFEATGEPFADRGERTDEIIEVMRQLWTGEPTSYAGKHVTIPEVTIAPAVSVPIPVIIGGTSAPAIRRAATIGDGWYGMNCELELACYVRDSIQKKREALEKSGPFPYYARLPMPYKESDVERYVASGFQYLTIQLDGCGGAPTDPIERKLELIGTIVERIRAVTD